MFSKPNSPSFQRFSWPAILSVEETTNIDLALPHHRWLTEERGEFVHQCMCVRERERDRKRCGSTWWSLQSFNVLQRVVSRDYFSSSFSYLHATNWSLQRVWTYDHVEWKVVLGQISVFTCSLSTEPKLSHNTLFFSTGSPCPCVSHFLFLWHHAMLVSRRFLAAV